MAKDKSIPSNIILAKEKFKYDTIQDMVNDITLKVGMVVDINGYYKPDDGATHKRVIADTDDGSGVQLRSGKWANIVHNGEVNVSWFGIKNNDTCADILNKIFNIKNINKVICNPITVYAQQLQPELGISIEVNRNNLEIIGNGIKILPLDKNVLRVINFKNCKNIKISGIRSIGYVEENNDYSSNGERYSCFSLSDGCENVEIFENHIDNYLGDCIYIGTSLSDGSVINPSKNIKIYNNYLKERYGNGAPTWNGGTQSRLAIAFIDVIDVRVYNNIIVGSLDFEPNADSQSIVNCNVYNNNFIAFKPISEVGERVEEKLGTEIMTRYITIAGRPGRPIISGNTARNNYSNSLNITDGGKYPFSKIESNDLGNGSIIIDSYTSGIKCSNNTTTETLLKISEEVILIDSTFIDNKFKKFMEYETENRFERNIIITNLECNNVLTPELNTIIYQGILSNKEIKNDIIYSKKYVRNNFINFADWKDETDIILSEGAVVNSFDKVTKYPQGTIVNFYSRSGTGVSKITVSLPVYKKELVLNSLETASFIRLGDSFQLLYTTGKLIDNNAVQELNTLYHMEKMKQEGVYNDYIMYMDDKVAYDKEQQRLEKERQAKYQKDLEANPKLTYEEWLSQQPKLLPYTEEPRLTSALQKFMDKYL